MKKLPLLMFAILILSCGTETTVVEKRPPVVIIDEPSHHPLIAHGTVKHGQVNVDPELSILHFEFTESFLRYQILLREKDGRTLAWDAPAATGTNIIFIREMRDDPLQPNTEYVLEIFALNYDCESVQIVIQFRTKPQRPVVGAPEPVIQERLPVAPLGERFRFDIAAPAVIAGDVEQGEANVDPEPLNADGIQFEWDTPIRKYKIDLRIHGGAFLGWLPRGLVEPDNPVRHTKIMPAEGFPLLEFDTTYQINIFVQDFGCRDSEFEMLFHTKPEP